ncbi:MAG: hypothetical protein LCH52_06400 [Bacteroidetes bacterium]|nr:hypothetical protein [Bacteroidota bacterium]
MRTISTLFVLLILAAPVFGQSINGRISSSVYMFERYDAPATSDFQARGYHSAILNLNYEKFSLRTHLNYENYFNTSADSRLRVYNLYFEARKLFDIATVKIGRQPVFSTIAGGVFDGVSVNAAYKMFGLDAWYGGNVPAYQKLEITDSWKDDYLLGGELKAQIIPQLLIGVGGFVKNFKPYSYTATRLDDAFNPISVLIQEKSNQYKFLQGRISYDQGEGFQFNARYEYDMNYQKTSRIEFDGVSSPVKNWHFNVYYNYLAPRIRYNSIFSVFDFANTTELEIGAGYDLTKSITLNGRVGVVSYQGDNASRFTISANTNFGSLSYRKSMGYAGEQDAISLYLAKSLFDGLITPSAGIAYTSYKLSPDAETNSLTTIMGGLNIRAIRWLSFDLQAQYLNNKIYKNDLRMFFKANYWFNTIF